MSGTSFNDFLTGALSGAAGPRSTTSVITSNYTVMKDGEVLFVDTTSGVLTITLTASPTDGQTVRIMKTAGINALSVAGNSNNINGSLTSQVLSVLVPKTLIYNATYGWGMF